MDFENIKAQKGGAWAWARTGALVLFLTTGILLIASLQSARSGHIQASSADLHLGFTSD
jgi:hypothetical protein